MNGYEGQFLRKYTGTANLIFSFCNLEKCIFDLHCYKNGGLRVICHTTESLDFIEILKHDTDKNKVAPLQASLHGTTNDGGEVSIQELFLDKTSLSSKSNTITKDRDGSMNIVSSDPFPTGTLLFIALSEVVISYSNIDENKMATIRFGIFNFEFNGEERSNPQISRLDQIRLMLGKLELKFVQDIDYVNIVERIRNYDKMAITSECEINTSFKDVDVAREILQHCSCWILSFATSNWIVFPYYDVYVNGVLIKTIILPISEPFEFVKAQNIISDWGGHDSIKEFLEDVFNQYLKFKDEFGLNHLIEYYVSAIRNRSIEETFLIITIAFECLCSYLLEFANKNKDVIISGDIENKKNSIRKVLRELDIKLMDDSITKIAEKVAYDKPGLKVLLRYFFMKFNIRYTEDDLEILYEFRNKIVHTGIVYTGQKKDTPILVKKSNIIISLLIRSILTLLGWRGKMFIDRGNNFNLVKLE